jgi:hypothetical protein
MHCRGPYWPLGHRSCHWRPCRNRCWCPRLAILRLVHGRSPILVDAARLLHGTRVWLSDAARLVVFLRPVHGRSPILVDAARLLCGGPLWISGATGGTLVHVASVTAVAALDAVVWGVGPAVSRRLPQLDDVRSPHARDRLGGRLRHHQPYHTHVGHILSPRPPSLAHPSSIIVGNGFVLPVTTVGDSVLPGPFYLNDVLVALDLVQSFLSVRRFTTDNFCFMEFDPFGLSVKNLATRRVLARYDSTGPFYTLPLPTLPTTTPRAIPYALATTASSATWHHRLGHPGPDVLSKLSSTSAITCPRSRDASLCHACQLGRYSARLVALS